MTPEPTSRLTSGNVGKIGTRAVPTRTHLADLGHPLDCPSSPISLFPSGGCNHLAYPLLYFSIEERIVEVVRFRQIRIMHYDLWH